MRFFSLAAVALLLAGCVETTPDAKKYEVEVIKLSASQFNTVKSAVRQNMKDPSSAQFGRYVAFRATHSDGTQTDHVCGYVNGKNSYGGYAGMTPYMANGLDGNFISAVGPTDVLMRVCQRQFGISI